MIGGAERRVAPPEPARASVGEERAEALERRQVARYEPLAVATGDGAWSRVGAAGGSHPERRSLRRHRTVATPRPTRGRTGAMPSTTSVA